MYDKEKYSVGPNLADVDLGKAIEIINEIKSKNLAEYEITRNGKRVKVTALTGTYGPYLQIKDKNKKNNYSIPKEFDPKNLTEEQIINIISKKKTFTKPKTTGGSKKRSTSRGGK